MVLAIFFLFIPFDNKLYSIIYSPHLIYANLYCLYKTPLLFIFYPNSKYLFLIFIINASKKCSFSTSFLLYLLSYLMQYSYCVITSSNKYSSSSFVSIRLSLNFSSMLHLPSNNPIFSLSASTITLGTTPFSLAAFIKNFISLGKHFPPAPR